MKMWKCSQCGNTVNRNLPTSFVGAPVECDACGSEEFEDPVTIGSFHSKLDRLLP